MERDRQLDIYERMTPIERNMELKGLFAQLPDFNAIWGVGANEELTGSELEATVEKIESGIEKRKNSEIRKILLARLKLLLVFSHTTQSFRDYLASEFDEMTTKGMEREPLSPPLTTEAEYFTHTFKWDKPESGGIFDPKDAESIEKEYYGHAVYLLGFEGWVEERLVQEGMGVKVEEIARELSEPFDKSEDDVAAEATVRDIMRRRKLVKDWRSEYIELHGDEP